MNKPAEPIVGDTRGRGYFWAMELVRDADNSTFDKPERDRMLRGYLLQPYTWFLNRHSAEIGANILGDVTKVTTKALLPAMLLAITVLPRLIASSTTLGKSSWAMEGSTMISMAFIKLNTFSSRPTNFT